MAPVTLNPNHSKAFGLSAGPVLTYLMSSKSGRQQLYLHLKDYSCSSQGILEQFYTSQTIYKSLKCQYAKNSVTVEEALIFYMFILIERAYNSCKIVKPIIYGARLDKTAGFS